MDCVEYKPVVTAIGMGGYSVIDTGSILSCDN